MTAKKSLVFFTDMRTTPDLSLPAKLRLLMKKAGFERLELDKQFTAVKMHLGEPGNLAYLRPNYAKVVADYVKEQGGLPFLTDCNTLYAGRRKNALEHLDAAYENGFNPFCTGCQVIIADGLKGTDEALVPVPGGEYVKEAKVGRALMDADVIISLSHFKGHIETGFGGALKNVGMGGGSHAGKMEMHNSGTPAVNKDNCVGCGRCERHCVHGAIRVLRRKAHIDEAKCVGCARCIAMCPYNAVHSKWDEASENLCRKMAEYAAAILWQRPQFHISLAVDVSPNCDCEPNNDAHIVPDIGMFASFDPVAIDQACADAVIKAPVLADTYLTENMKKHPREGDPFGTMHPDTHWQITLDHAEKLGLGTRKYELVKI